MQIGDRIVWSDSHSINIPNEADYTVTVSMDVPWPSPPEQVGTYLIEPQELSIDFMKKASQYLMKGEIFDGTESKQDVEREMLAFKQDVASHTILDGYQENADAWLDFLEERYNAAPDSNTEAKYEYKPQDGGKILHLKSYPPDNSIADFCSLKGGIAADGFSFRSANANRIFRLLYPLSDAAQAEGVKATYQQALETADSAIAFLFEEPFAMTGSYMADKANFLQYLWTEDEDESEGQAYVFYYTRSYDGIPALLIDQASTYGAGQERYALPYSREYACIIVDDRGIVKMWYDCYSRVVETLNENVVLMPFEEILIRFQDGVFYHNFWGMGGTHVNIEITDIVFGMVREPMKDNPDQYMMVPAWNFVGDMANNSWEADYGSEQKRSILALNALDGSIITNYGGITYPK